MSDVQEPGPEGGAVQWGILGNDHMRIHCEQTDTGENVTFPQTFSWRVVKIDTLGLGLNPGWSSLAVSHSNHYISVCVRL